MNNSGIFNNVEWVAPLKRNKNPIVERRNTFVKNLQKQIDVLQGKEDVKCRKWFQEDVDGVIGSVCFANSPIAIKPNKTHLKVGDKDALVDIYESVMEQANDGQWDKRLKDHSEKYGKVKLT